MFKRSLLRRSDRVVGFIGKFGSLRTLEKKDRRSNQHVPDLYTFKRDPKRSNQMIRIFHFTHCSRNVWFNWLFVWALVDFYKWIMLRWSPRRDKWRPCSCELEDSHLQWWWWNSWNDMCIEAEVWDLPNFSWFGIDYPWLFFTEERETLLMRLWFWWTVCLRSRLYSTRRSPKKKSFRHLLYTFGNP